MKTKYTLAAILGIVFFVLKLTHVVSWPWLWVLSPFWISGSIRLLAYAFLGACYYHTKVK